MNGYFDTSALYTSKDSVNLQLYTDFSRSNYYGTEWKRSKSESDVTSHGTGQQLNFDDDTQKGKDSYNC